MTNYLFNPFLDSFFEPAQNRKNETPSIMDVDILETENEYELEADLPGFNKEDVSVEFEKGYLTISAHKEKKTIEGAKQVYSERAYGKLRRRFYFGEIEDDKITANYDNGVMKVVLPKRVEKNTSRSIAIS